ATTRARPRVRPSSLAGSLTGSEVHDADQRVERGLVLVQPVVQAEAHAEALGGRFPEEVRRHVPAGLPAHEVGLVDEALGAVDRPCRQVKVFRPHVRQGGRERLGGQERDALAGVRRAGVARPGVLVAQAARDPAAGLAWAGGAKRGGWINACSSSAAGWLWSKWRSSARFSSSVTKKGW